jgi:hypothetical protein
VTHGIVVQLILGGNALKKLTVNSAGHDPLSVYRIWGVGVKAQWSF